jgi:hypothetical protein
MLLEEALLYLLRVSGYQVVERADNDETLKDGHSGLEVLGRGGKHQIDAVANFVVAHPFSHPQRLLIEAKCYTEQTRVGIEVIRNAVGVLKDVSEYWVSRGSVPPKARYHYQYALFSASGYTSDAERYAYAQDVYLIPLANSRFIQPIIGSIRELNYQHFGAVNWNAIQVDMAVLRREIRSSLRERWEYDYEQDFLEESVSQSEAHGRLRHFCRLVHEIDGAVLAMINRQFPVFLVPNPAINIAKLKSFYKVRIYWDNEGWYLRSAYDNKNLFSFDLPPKLFELYAEQGILSETSALDLKRDFLSNIQAILTLRERIKAITFRLDGDWLERVRRTLHDLQDI